MMTSNLRDLWYQAGGRFNMGNQHEWPTWVINDPTTFTDLIIRECAKFIDTREQVDKYGEAHEVVHGSDLLKHFGIEDD